MDRAAVSAGRDPKSVTLIAVSKTVPIERIQEAYDLGIRDFGESRWQEAELKIKSLPDDIRWHFIGHLQSNKARRVAENVYAIHTLSSMTQLKAIESMALATPVQALIEVNIAKEPQKSGIFAEALDEFVEMVLQCSKVHFRGLMTIGPANLNAELMRPFFESMRFLNQKVGGSWLSMGMSDDFEVAIQEGSTHVRIGSALFGARRDI